MMQLDQAVGLVRQNMSRNPKHYLFASVGIVVGVAMLGFFVALGTGVRAKVLNTYFPVDQVELEPASVGVLGVQRALPTTEVNPERLAALAEVEGVTGVFPKQRSRFQARLWGGRGLFGRDMHGEAFFDGIAPALVKDELARRELGPKSVEPEPRPGRTHPCDTIEDCPGGFDCEGGICRSHRSYEDFVDHPVHTPCDRPSRCPADHSCHEGLCRPPCEGEGAAWCPTSTCASDADCPSPLACLGEGSRRCGFLACTLPGGPKDQDRETPKALRGRVDGRCAGGEDPGDPDCEPAGCPGGTYCAGVGVRADHGFCEKPLPTVVNPFLLDIFNATAASSLGLSQVSDARVILGIAYRMRFGDSFFKRGENVERQVVRRARVVGFSDKAPLVGVSMPLGVVQHANARFRGREAASSYDTVIVRTGANEDMSGLIRAAEQMQFVLAPSSRQARRLANMLLILTGVFGLISVVIIAIAGVNIAHTFLVIVGERRTEIGIMRALGATGGDIRRLVMCEAALVGLAGGLLGHVLAWLMSRGANAAAAQLLSGLVLLPDDLFAFDVAFLLLSIVGAVLCAMLGARGAAREAARLDPAVVLTTP